MNKERLKNSLQMNEDIAIVKETYPNNDYGYNSLVRDYVNVSKCYYIHYEKYCILKQALNEIREYCNFQIKENKTLIERLDGTNSFRIGNAKSAITEFKNILQIIDKAIGDEKND